jgi:hypothetical protein
LALLWAVPLPACAQDRNDAARLAAHLAAGEFAPAIEIARNAPSQQQHDAWLGQIAAAQAGAGIRQAAIRSAGEIYDDRARTDALAGVTAQPLGGRGGGTMADFDSLIDLITTTIQPTSWDEVGGPGSISQFATGVYFDPQGVLQPLARSDRSGSLAELYTSSADRTRAADVRRPSALRKISLPRLEKQVQLRLAAGLPPSEAMQVLAGLQRIEYVFVYPDSGDLVLAGPAGDWTLDHEARIVSADSGRPVVRLDDLVVVLRQMTRGGDGRFGCLINPRPEGLARVQQVLSRPAASLRTAAERAVWLEGLRTSVGTQDIEVYGLDPATRAAAVMVEADYRMKLVGMGLEEGTPGVLSYLDLIEIPPGGSPPPMSVLRWWFTLDYDSLLTSEDRRAFAVRGQGLKVLSENELLTATGRRVHTGESDELNRRFAQSFTTHFEALAAKYPVYAELRNLADLALVAALMREEGLAEKCGWHMTCFGPSGSLATAAGRAPREVETVANDRVIREGRRIHTIAGLSGGVRIDPASLVRPEAIETDRYGELTTRRADATAGKLAADAWWWD